MKNEESFGRENCKSRLKNLWQRTKGASLFFILQSPFTLLLFGLAIFAFWRYGYYFALSYQEQFQLFLFDTSYFVERIAQPGGFARYVAEFLVQFYNSGTIGALVLAILFVVFQRLTSSYLSAIALLLIMGDENVMLTYTISLILSMVFILVCPKRKIARWVYLLVMIPVIYWLIGPMVLLTALVLMPLSAIYALACIFVSAYFVHYPLKQLMIGIDYYRFVDIVPYSLFAVPVMVLILNYRGRFAYLPAIKSHAKCGQIRLSAPTILCVFCLLCVLCSSHFYDKKKYELMEYDYLVRIKDWNGIIAKAEKKMPDLPLSVCATNLALAMTNQLGERAFDFYQRGREGLLPPFERQFVLTQLTSDVYFHLGLVNTAQRFAFESMEALPNYNKSGRAVKRLAETNIINGQYDVARKYLQMLQKTIFYRQWAEKRLEMIVNEDSFKKDSSISNLQLQIEWLRKVRLQDDFLFSEDEVDKICGQLFSHEPKNMMAVQYLLMLPLLDKDLNRFMQYLQYVQKYIRYNPRVCQEAVCIAFAQRNQQPPQGAVSPMVLKSFGEFVKAYQGNLPALERFRHSTWYYLLNEK